MLRLANIVTLLLTLLISAAYAEGNGRRDNVSKLIPLGEARINYGENRAVIDVPQLQTFFDNKLFRALLLFADDKEVYLQSIDVHYFQGNPRSINVGKPIPRDEQIRVDLGFPQSYMRQIVMYYNSWTDYPQSARIRVFGELANVDNIPNPTFEWVQLGKCQEINIWGIDRDVFPVQTRGPFRALRLKALNHSVEMLDLEVIDTENASHDIPVRRWIHEQYTEELVLKRGERDINRIVMIYRSQISPTFELGRDIKPAMVCVEGQRRQR